MARAVNLFFSLSDGRSFMDAVTTSLWGKVSPHIGARTKMRPLVSRGNSCKPKPYLSSLPGIST